MTQESKNLKRVELQYCVQCPTCNEIFKVRPDEESFVQTCVFCKHQFQVTAPGVLIGTAAAAAASSPVSGIY